MPDFDVPAQQAYASRRCAPALRGDRSFRTKWPPWPLHRPFSCSIPGSGGLTVFREVLKARPDARYVYVADDAFFPYGDHGEAELVARVVALMGELIEAHRPDLIVIACNTASTLVLPHLRARFSVPFVGTVPAIKPACAQSVTKRVTVLGTEATVSREYTRALIRDFANGCRRGAGRLGAARGIRRGGVARRRRSPITLIAAGDHALLRRCGRTAHRHDRARLHALSAAARPSGAARAHGRSTSSIPRRRSPGGCRSDRPQAPSGEAPAPARIVFTSGRPPSATLETALSRFGIGG